MKQTKLLSILTVVVLIVSSLAACTSKSSDSAGNKNVKITFLNSKGEISTQLEDAVKVFNEDNPDITVEIVQAGAGESPFQKASSMYASGNAPSILMLDTTDVKKFADKFADLSSEKWINDALEGVLDPVTIDEKVMAFPFVIEGYGLIYNKAVLDKASVDPKSIKTTKDLEEAFKKIQGIGVSPMIVSPMDWSLGAHYFSIAYYDQAKETEEVNKFFEDLKAGKVNLKNNTVFNGVMTTFDLLKENNIDKASPLAGTYEKAPEYLGTGKAAFWFMGNWAWPQIKEFDKANGQYGFIPVPVSNNASDYGNSQIYVGATKFLGIDTKNNNEAQQAAAKKFLEWLVYNDKGQDFMVNKANLVTAFSNIKLPIIDPLGNSIKEYIDENQTISFSNYIIPGDHWAQVGGFMQKYLDGKSDKETLATDIQNYWKNVK